MQTQNTNQPTVVHYAHASNARRAVKKAGVPAAQAANFVKPHPQGVGFTVNFNAVNAALAGLTSAVVAAHTAQALVAAHYTAQPAPSAAVATVAPVSTVVPVTATPAVTQGKGKSVWRNGVRAPLKPTGLCAQVWACCNELVASGIPMANITLVHVNAFAQANGFNLNNAKIEFYAWRKFNA